MPPELRCAVVWCAIVFVFGSGGFVFGAALLLPVFHGPQKRVDHGRRRKDLDHCVD